MVGVYRGLVSGVFPNAKAFDETINFLIDGNNQDFYYLLDGQKLAPSDAARFNPESNIFAIKSSAQIIGAVGARNWVINPGPSTLHSNVIKVTAGRVQEITNRNIISLPFEMDFPVNTVLKIDQLITPLLYPRFAENIILSLDTRNLQDVYLGQPCFLQVDLEVIF